jgi:hypothetical protein
MLGNSSARLQRKRTEKFFDRAEIREGQPDRAPPPAPLPNQKWPSKHWLDADVLLA